MVVGKLPDDEETRVLAGRKNNLSLPCVSLAYGIETAENGAARIVYRGASEATAGRLLKIPADEGEKSALTEAKEFLLSQLRSHPISARQVKKDVEEADISYRTLKRVKQALGVRSEKESEGSWTWILPGEKAEGGQAPTDGTLGPVGPLDKDANPEPAYSAYFRQEGQVGQEAKCIHGFFRDGTGCYLCDPRHPHRLDQGGAV